ncbi:hypothetical protein ASL14_09380 [Paenibacillus sp. IHB B 3084]|uniref:hypothetical protein n=1 Tax=Paenibacillus sp. IHB B 3084 TaxID=867076 RepID=UPI00071FFF62|nr:hypothetical protein [Paenibacillus sp. IHB B 3084]ALP36350.1 hypothetical protein ASL14_09380 [Paenibacillus sp. IHB B 3084]
MTVLANVQTLKDQLSVEFNFVTARAEAKGIDVVFYMTLAGIQASMFRAMEHAYNVDHAINAEGYALSTVYLSDEMNHIQKLSKLLSEGPYSRLGGLLKSRVDSVLSDFSKLAEAEGNFPKASRLLEKRIPRGIINVGKLRSSITAALQREKAAILEA